MRDLRSPVTFSLAARLVALGFALLCAPATASAEALDLLGTSLGKATGDRPAAQKARRASGSRPANLVGTGGASFYGHKDGFAGKETANGERMDPEAMTAAHKTLPLGSRVRVQRVDTGASVEVRINDRGPYAGGRIIDLSYGAARRLGMVDLGVTRVRVYRVR